MRGVRRWRPFLRRALSTARPARVDIRFRKPCTRTRRRILGWYVLLGISSIPVPFNMPNDYTLWTCAGQFQHLDPIPWLVDVRASILRVLDPA